jgi:hypothetical protein
MTTYPDWRKKRCVHCAAGVPMSQRDGFHWTGNHNPPKCTAPTEAEYIAELEASLNQTRVERDNYASQLTLSTKWYGQERHKVAELEARIIELNAPCYCCREGCFDGCRCGDKH